MAHDPSFLAKCEQFLLHPTVRALSLAQRVDFLENKGLSPEEITACLKNVERQNGLSRMLLGGASAAALASGAASGESPLGVAGAASSSSLWVAIRRYGVATAATLLLAYGYVRLRQKLVMHLVLAQRQAALKRRQQRQVSVVEAMRFVADQRKQYDQVLARVKSRVTRIQLLQSTHVNEEDGVVSAEQKRRELEVRALKEQVTTLKQVVLEAYKGELRTQVHHEMASARESETLNESASGLSAAIKPQIETSSSPVAVA